MTAYNRCRHCGGFLKHYTAVDLEKKKSSRHVYVCNQGLTTLNGIEPCGRAYVRDDERMLMEEAGRVWQYQRKAESTEIHLKGVRTGVIVIHQRDSKPHAVQFSSSRADVYGESDLLEVLCISTEVYSHYLEADTEAPHVGEEVSVLV